ncbi:MAG: helix-turn-helix domain-containing protein [Clostridia bacterium]|nr:helix-turn-helix domain-containing protein [Clostridia bacterium]
MFKNKLLDLMSEKSINSQRQLSSLTGIPATTISGWINAGRLPDYAAIKKLSNFFNVSSDELLEQNEYGTPTTAMMGEASTLSEKEKALLKAFKNLLPETQDFVLRTAQSLSDTSSEKTLKKS